MDLLLHDSFSLSGYLFFSHRRKDLLSRFPLVFPVIIFSFVPSPSIQDFASPAPAKIVFVTLLSLSFAPPFLFSRDSFFTIA